MKKLIAIHSLPGIGAKGTLPGATFTSPDQKTEDYLLRVGAAKVAPSKSAAQSQAEAEEAAEAKRLEQEEKDRVAEEKRKAAEAAAANGTVDSELDSKTKAELVAYADANKIELKDGTKAEIKDQIVAALKARAADDSSSSQDVV